MTVVMFVADDVAVFTLAFVCLIVSCCCCYYYYYHHHQLLFNKPGTDSHPSYYYHHHHTRKMNSAWMMITCKVLALRTHHIKYKALHRKARAPNRTLSLILTTMIASSSHHAHPPSPTYQQHTTTRDSW